MNFSNLSSIIFGAALVLVPLKTRAAPILRGDAQVTLEGKPSGFDFMATDRENHRIIAAHKGTGTLEILDSKTGLILKGIPVGEAQGVAVDPTGRRYFVGNEREKSLVVIDAKTFERTAEISVEGPIDGIAYDSKNGKVYAAEDDGSHVWVIDPEKKLINASISIPGEPEGIEYSPHDNKLYLSIKTTNEVVRIDPETNKVDRTFPTAPVTSPHGIAIDERRGLVYVAGKNGKIAAIDLLLGKVTSSAEIATGNDQLVYDVERELIFSACAGAISITRASARGLVSVGQVPSPKGAHTIALDFDNHSLWVVFADKAHSYFQKFVTE